ncbi:MAG: hypothetical protein KF785_01355 [Gemmatimonadales bacterium]|nr:hypothetical protein [Gemmatimonadales bacterium]
MNDLDQARREAIRLLCRAQADDRLSVEGFETRLDGIKRAPNQASIAAIIADLTDDSPTGTLAPATRAYGLPTVADHTAVRPVAPAEFSRISSVFGSTKRGGSWTVPLLIEARVLLGEMTLDLRDAVFGADVVDIAIDVDLGSFTLIVPAGTQVENEVRETLSSSSHSTRSVGGVRPNGLLVRLAGQATLASVEIKEKLPSGARNRKPGLLGRLLKQEDD